MSKLSDFFKKNFPAFDIVSLYLKPYVEEAKSLTRPALVRKVSIPLNDLRKLRELDTPGKMTRATALRDAQANATADLVLFLADAE